MTQPAKIPGTSNDAAREAREQAEAYKSLFAGSDLKFDDGGTLKLPPHPNLGLWDDDRQEAYEELQFEMESYDRDDDVYIPEQKLDDGAVIPAVTRKGPLLHPYRKDGVLVKPPHSVRVVQAGLGEDGYKQLRSGMIDGRQGSAADIWRIWNLQGLELKAREDVDNKSDGSDLDVAAVPPPDSV